MASSFELRKQADSHAAQYAVQSEKLKRWLEEKHPDIHFGEAVLKAFHEDMGNSAFLTATDEDFEYSLSTTRTNFSRRRIPSEKETKADLIEQIMSALQSTNNKHWTIPFNVKSERTRMSYWSVEELTKRLDGIVRAQELNAKPVSELYQIVATGKEEPSMYPKLPLYTDDGKPLDADYLNWLARFDKATFIRLVKRFSSEAIDRRRGIK